MKNIVVLQGSPRIKGNTAQLARAVVEQFAEDKVTVNWYDLNKLNMKGCQSCYACKKQLFCVIKDDAEEILQKIAKADAVIFATPVYMWDMTGQLKLMVDRLFTFMNMDFTSKLAPGKKFLFVVTQGQPDPDTFKANFEKSVKIIQMLGFGEARILVAGGTMEMNDIQDNVEKLSEAKRMGQWLIA